MRKQLILMCIIAGFFLNSCAAIPMIAGAGTLGCVAYEVQTKGGHTEKETCPVIVAIDEGVEEWKSSNILIDVN